MNDEVEVEPTNTADVAGHTAVCYQAHTPHIKQFKYGTRNIKSCVMSCHAPIRVSCMNCLSRPLQLHKPTAGLRWDWRDSADGDIGTGKEPPCRTRTKVMSQTKTDTRGS